MQARKIEYFGNTEGKKYISAVRDYFGSARHTYFVETYGCQMNVRDSETLMGLFEEMGYTPAEVREEADAVIFNTCCVREGAEERLLGNLGKLKGAKAKKPDMLIMICGCMMQENGKAEKIKKSFRFVDVVFGTHNTHEMPKLMYKALTEKKREFDVWEKDGDIIEDMPVKRESSFSAWVNIMYGCNNFCSYCIVPYVRGRERSRKSGDIIKEVRGLVADGIKEVTLLGQNVNSYGKERDEISFPELLGELDKIEGLERIRFMTSHPKDLSDSLIDAFKSLKHLCKYIHLPVQSGSNRILKLMNRHYTREDYIALVQKLRNAVPDIAISTDIIVGFPTETEEDFLDTLDLYKTVCFNSAYTFIYSPREGTPAAKMEGQVAEADNKSRMARLIALSEECSEKLNKSYIGKTVEVLVEGVARRGEDFLCGRDGTARMINFKGDKSLIGKIVSVKITSARLNVLEGEGEG